jgi:hypothetical protein
MAVGHLIQEPIDSCIETAVIVLYGHFGVVRCDVLSARTVPVAHLVISFLDDGYKGLR